MAAFSFEEAMGQEQKPAAGAFSFEDVAAPAKEQVAPVQGRAAPAQEPAAPAVDPSATPVTPGSSVPMPGILEAGASGLREATQEFRQSLRAMSGQRPELPEPTRAAEPLALSDIASPIGSLAPKLAYGIAKSYPTLAGGLAGGIPAGLAGGPVAGIAGGAVGAGITTAVQSVAPYFLEELKANPKDPDAAWDRAITKAEASGLFSAAGWAAFPLRAFAGPIKQMAFQALGVQPGIGMAERATQNVISGRPATEGLGEAYVHSAIGTSIPMAGHAAVSKIIGGNKINITEARAQDPVLSRLANPEESSGWIPDFGRIYTAVKDDLHPIKEATQRLSDQPLPAGQDPYILARLTRGSQGKADHFVRYGAFDPVTRENIGPSLKSIIEPFEGDMEGFRKYILSRTAVELNQKGIKTGIPTDEARSYIQDTTGKYGSAFKQYVDYNRNLLKYLVKSGILNDDQYNAMIKAREDYAPLYRLMDQEGSGPPNVGGGLHVRNPIMRMTGSERLILDPIESSIKNTFHYISLADRNMALQALEKLVQKSPDGDQIMVKQKPTVRPIEVTGPEVKRALERQGIETVSDPNEFTVFRPNPFRPAPDEIAVFNNGKRSVYRADPYLASAINNLDREAIGTLTKILAVPSRMLRAGATLAPEFIARNPIRDQFSAFVFSTLGRGYVPFYDFIRGIGPVMGAGKAYQDWLKSGGAQASLVSIDRNYMQNAVKALKDPSTLKTIKNVVTSPIDLLRAASEIMENATRVGEFSRLMKRGESPEAAGFASREITLDFQRIGSKMRAVNAMIAFFNAQVEGVDRAFRSMRQQPLGFLAKTSAAITLPSLYLWWANKDDPRMQEIPRWQKDMFWIIPTDKWENITPQQAANFPKGYTRQLPSGQWQVNNGNIWRVPKPFELGILFGSVPERILDAYYKKDPNAFKKFGSTLAGAFLPNFIPQVASPVIEQFANRSLFTERPLVPQYLDKNLPQYQATPYTTDTAKYIGQFLSKVPGLTDKSITSPIIVENYVRAWTGTLGRYALDGSDQILRGLGVAPSKVTPTLTNADKALIRAFAVRFPEGGANSIQDFYEEYDKRQKAKATRRYLAKAGEAQSAEDVMRNNVMVTADGLHKALGNQFKIIRDVYRNPKMSPDEKRNFIDASYLQMIKMAQTGNEIFAKTKKEFEERRKAE